MYPACLTDKQPQTGEEMTITGWGTIQYQGARPTTLQKANIKIVDFKTCNQRYKGLTQNMICAADTGKDSCQGDSGGPLIIKGEDETTDVQVGVVSWGIGCAREEFPGVYARVESGLDFIENIKTCTYAEGENELCRCG